MLVYYGQIYPPMAQLDNAADSDSEERGFKSLWAGQPNVIANVLGEFTLLGKEGSWTREGLSVKKTVRWTVFSEEREAGTEIQRIWVAERIVCASTDGNPSGRANLML